jgi:hypothetical protein
MGSFWHLVEYISISVALIKPGLWSGHFNMKYIEDIIITIVFIGVVTGLSTCEPNKRNCDIFHSAGKPAHKCETY